MKSQPVEGRGVKRGESAQQCRGRRQATLERLPKSTLGSATRRQALCPSWEQSPLTDGEGNQVTGAQGQREPRVGTRRGENPFKPVEKKGGDFSLSTCWWGKANNQGEERSQRQGTHGRWQGGRERL